VAWVDGDNYINKRGKRVRKIRLILVIVVGEVGQRRRSAVGQAREMALLGGWLGDGLPS
jgi:hypothetical protein